MGFLDKVKQQAAQVGQKAQEGVKSGQEKVAEAQAKKRADALLRDLGAAVYAERAGRGTAETAAEIERLASELRNHEAEHGPIDTGATAGTAPGVAGEAGGDLMVEDVAAGGGSATPVSDSPAAPLSEAPTRSPAAGPAPEGDYKLDDF